jgi:ubiquinone biosynthesis protein COQ4
MDEVRIGEGERSYFNGASRQIETDSSVLVSSSPYLGHAQLRGLIAQEMLRRNGSDLPNTAYIPEVAQILFQLEDLGQIVQLFEEEKARLPEFKAWLDKRQLADFKKDEVKDCAPGTLGAALHDFMVNSGYELDIFFREIQVVNDFTFYLRQTALTHDIEHMVSGFGPNHGGEIALLTANMHSKVRYFRPELAAFFNRIPTYLKAKTIMKDGLHYPAAAALNLEAEYRGHIQAQSWKYPLMLVNWREYVDVQIDAIRAELGIFPIPPDGLWAGTNALCEDFCADNDDTVMAAAE